MTVGKMTKNNYDRSGQVCATAFATFGASLKIIPNGEQRRRQMREQRPPDGRYEVTRSIREKDRRRIIGSQEILSGKKRENK